MERTGGETETWGGPNSRWMEEEEEEEVIYFGQGYRYTLRDQDASCLAQGTAACSKSTTGVGNKTVMGGGFKYGRKGTLPSKTIEDDVLCKQCGSCASKLKMRLHGCINIPWARRSKAVMLSVKWGWHFEVRR